jgi:hypothetical protein
MLTRMVRPLPLVERVDLNALAWNAASPQRVGVIAFHR